MTKINKNKQQTYWKGCGEKTPPDTVGGRACWCRQCVLSAAIPQKTRSRSTTGTNWTAPTTEGHAQPCS